MDRSPVSLLDYFPKQLEIRPNPEYVEPDPDTFPAIDVNGIVSEIEFGLAHRMSSPDVRVYGIRLTLRSAPQANGIPYQFVIALEGFVDIDESQEPDQSKRDQLAAVNGPAVLYGAAREMLLSVTHRFPKGPLLLPSVNFLAGRDGFSAIRKELEVRQAKVSAKTRSKDATSKSKKGAIGAAKRRAGRDSQ